MIARLALAIEAPAPALPAAGDLEASAHHSRAHRHGGESIKPGEALHRTDTACLNGPNRGRFRPVGSAKGRRGGERMGEPLFGIKRPPTFVTGADEPPSMADACIPRDNGRCPAGAALECRKALVSIRGRCSPDTGSRGR
jgi:hypothetical protein